jgi:hypothetical protein
MNHSVITMTSARNITAFILMLLVKQLSAQVKLNELMVYPVGPLDTPPNGLIYNGSKEYIEIYNDTCVPVNVAGFFIAMRQEFNGKVSGGTFRIPAIPQALIPSKGHLVLGQYGRSVTTTQYLSIRHTRSRKFCFIQ